MKTRVHRLHANERSDIEVSLLLERRELKVFTFCRMFGNRSWRFLRNVWSDMRVFYSYENWNEEFKR